MEADKLPDNMEARTPAPEGEVVAWRTRYKPGGSAALWTVSTADPRPSWPPAVVVNYEVQPLYASPVVPVGVSREAIARIIDGIQLTIGDHGPRIRHGERLRATKAIIAAIRPTDTERE